MSANLPKPERHWKSWTEADLKLLVNRFKAGDTFAEIARKLQRTPGAITGQLIKMGLLEMLKPGVFVKCQPFVEAPDISRHGHPWTDDERKLLSYLFLRGDTPEAISLRIKRKYAAIANALEGLGHLVNVVGFYHVRTPPPWFDGRCYDPEKAPWIITRSRIPIGPQRTE